MYPRTLVTKLTSVYVLYLLFHTVRLNTNETFDNLHVFVNPVTWLEAVELCKENFSTLVDINPDPDTNIHNISVVKRSLHLSRDAVGWIGDYSTFELRSGQASNAELNTDKQFCAAIHVTLEKVLNRSALFYEYDVKAENCTSYLEGLCTDMGKSIGLSESSNDWSGTGSQCNMWIPEFTTLPVAREGVFATGNRTVFNNNTMVVDKTYWVNLLLVETRSTLPVQGNIFRCGYINGSGPGIYYSDCSVKKSYICLTDLLEEPEYLRQGGARPGLYAGISIALILTLSAVVTTVVFVRRKRGQCGDDISKLPQGGKSFTRRKQNDADCSATENKRHKNENRVTTYNQIIFDNGTTNVLDNQNSEKPGGHSAQYATIDRTCRKGIKPEVMPRSTCKKGPGTGRTGYLSMHGNERNLNKDVDKDYDFLNSTRSAGGKKYDDLDGRESMYSSTSGMNESEYDVTFQRGSSQKRLVSEDYDHVAMKSDSDTMNNRTCYSVNVDTRVPVVHVSPTRSNPGYDKVTIQ